MYTHELPSHTHTINQPSIYDDYGFRIDPLKEEDLEEGEVLCDMCKGYGYINNEQWGRMVCRKCQGEAKLDWIERIVGKKEPEFISGYSACTAYSSGFSGSSGSPSGYWGVGQAVNGISGYVVYGSGVPNSGYYQVSQSHTHSINQQRSPPQISKPNPPPVGTTQYDSLTNQLKVYDGNSWIVVESKITIGNKLMNGLKKLIRGK